MIRGPGFFKHHDSGAVRRAYSEGRTAAACGKGEGACPYRGSTDPRPGGKGKSIKSLKRQAWLEGHRDRSRCPSEPAP